MSDPKTAVEAVEMALSDDQPPAEPDHDIVPELEIEPELEATEEPEDVDNADPEGVPEEEAPPEHSAADADDGEPGEEPDAPAGEEERPAEEEVDAAPDAPDDKESEPEKAEAADEEDKPEGKASDEFGDLPKNTKQETRDRFQQLKDKYDEQHQELERVQAQNEEWVGSLRDSGMTGDQLGMVLQYVKAVNSGTPEGLMQAYQFMHNETEVLAKALGMESPGYDPLDSDPKLKQEYENGEITKERAHEIIKSRQHDYLQKEYAGQQTESQKQQDSIQAGMDSLSELGGKLSKDPHWEAKQPLLAPLVKTVVNSQPDPSKWAAAVEAAYNELPAPAPPPPPPPPAAGHTAPNPLRPSADPSTGQNLSQKPKSALEAVEQALNL